MHLLTEYILPHLPWIIAAGVLALVLACAVFLIVRAVLHRRHDKALEAEAQAEAARVAPSALEAEVSVIPQEALPQDDGNIFMPVPSGVAELVDFVKESRDGIAVRSCIRAEDADALLTDERASALCAVVYRPEVDMDDCVYLSVDVLSANFAPYSYIDLSILKRHGFAAEAATALSICGEGVLRKPLMIEAHAFSLTAVKMISLTGGRAIEVKSTSR